MSSEQRRKRQGYEFSNQTKMDALRKSHYKCECCKRQDSRFSRLEFHHKLGIAVARHFYPELSREIIRSLANCKTLCHECHLKADIEDQKNHEVLAQALLGLVQKALI